MDPGPQGGTDVGSIVGEGGRSPWQRAGQIRYRPQHTRPRTFPRSPPARAAIVLPVMVLGLVAGLICALIAGGLTVESLRGTLEPTDPPPMMGLFFAGLAVMLLSTSIFGLIELPARVRSRGWWRVSSPEDLDPVPLRSGRGLLCLLMLGSFLIVAVAGFSVEYGWIKGVLMLAVYLVVPSAVWVLWRWWMSRDHG